MGETYFGYRFLLLLAIVAANAFFAFAETALISVRRSRLRELAAEGKVGAQAALNLLGRPERLLATVQVGVTLASLGAGWAGEDTLRRLLMHWVEPVATPATAALIQAASIVVAFLVLAFAMVVLGEIVPKNLALERSDRFATLVAPALLVCYRVMEPFVVVLARSAAAVSRLLGRGAGAAATHSIEELRLITSSVRAAGQITRFQEEAVHRLLDLGQIAAREVMAPRTRMAALQADASLDHTLRTLIEHQYSRLPVYQTRPEQVIGILHYKDLLPVWERRRLAMRTHAEPPPFQLRALLRKPLVAPESKPLSQMIDEFRLNHAHMAMVVDEFGTIVGLVTLEDVLEQIFGEIEDEHDASRPRPAQAAAVLELEGSVSIRDLQSQYGLELPSNAGFETLAGFLLFRLGYIPSAGDRVEHEGRRYTILAMERHRIARVRVEPAPPQ